MEINDYHNKYILKKLCDVSAMTWEGLLLDEKSANLIQQECGTDKSLLYVIKGKEMNEVLGLKGDNAYPNDLNIVSIYPSKEGLLAIQVGARWLDDIVANNLAREGVDYESFFEEED